MYGIGYGLGKMMEGATGGAVKGTMVNMAREEREKERTSTEQYREKSLGMQQQRIDSEENRVKIQNHAAAFKIAFDIAQGSPDPTATFASVFKGLDPESEVPSITLGETGTDMEISYEGLGISGSKDHIMQAIGIISQNPDVTPQVLSKLAELGLAKITVPKPEKAKEYQPQLFTGPGGATQWIKPGDPVPAGYVKSSEAGKGGLKVGDINTALNALFKKYKVDAGLGINVTPDGKYTVDMATFMAGKETAYNIIKKKADAGDPEAKKDLEKINEYYGLMDGIIRGSRNTGPSLNKMGSNAAGGKATPSGGKNKATFDPATGRITYK